LINNKLHLNQYSLDNLKNKNTLCLIDGEHYPPVIKSALKELESREIQIDSLFMLGGTEKISGLNKILGEDYHLILHANQNIINKFENTLQERKIEAVLDLSDEPVVDYRNRFRLASCSIKYSLPYFGGDFTFQPPERKPVLKKPSLSIIGTGKRIGKTALGVTISRILQNKGIKPTIVCMGRGGPPEPEVVPADQMEIDTNTLFKVAEQGQHAASDYWEDALFSGTKTIGCHRCGGGMTGNPVYSNVIKGAQKANELEGDFVIMEGSGPTFPPVSTDKNITLIGANQPLWKIFDYFGIYRIMVADLIIITLSEPPMAEKKKLNQIEQKLSELKPDTKKLFTVFRPAPRGNISGKKVFVATAASNNTQNLMVNYLQNNYDCQLQGYTNNLSDRQKLSRDLENGLKNSDVLLTEIKAASIDMAAKKAKEMGVEVTFLHNEPKIIKGQQSELKKAILSIYNNIK